MRPSAPFRAVVTGGPGAGKSTLLAAIAELGVHCFPETARVILKEPGGMAMRSERPIDFADAMFSADLKTWAAAPFGPSLYDRGFPDVVGFLQLGGLPVPQEFDRVCSELRYEGPIFRAPPWREIYISDDERIQSWDEAIASDAAVTAAWTYYGYRLIDLPFVPISDRVRFVMEHFDANIDS